MCFCSKRADDVEKDCKNQENSLVVLLLITNRYVTNKNICVGVGIPHEYHIVETRLQDYKKENMERV